MSLKGYFYLTPNRDNVHKSATYNLLMTASNGDSVLFDGFKLERYIQFVGLYDIDYNGDVYFSDSGKLTIRTEAIGLSNKKDISYLTSYIYVSGSKNVIISMKLQDKALMSIEGT